MSRKKKHKGKVPTYMLRIYEGTLVTEMASTFDVLFFFFLKKTISKENLTKIRLSVWLPRFANFCCKKGEMNSFFYSLSNSKLLVRLVAFFYSSCRLPLSFEVENLPN